MTTTRTEAVPATWDDARDVPFFRVTASLFPARFCFGGSVLLASYDDDTPTTVTTSGTAHAERHLTTVTRTHVAGQTWSKLDVVPAQVRRER